MTGFLNAIFIGFSQNKILNILLGIEEFQKLKAPALIKIISESISEEELNKKFQIQTARTKRRRFISFLSAFFLAFAAFIGFTQDIKGFGKDVISFLGFKNWKVYEFDLPINQKIPNILILPFNQYGKGAEDIGKLVHLRLNKIKEEDSLLVNFIYCENCAVGKNFNQDSAKYIVKKYELDLIIFGDQLAENCSPSGKDEVCINYLTNSIHQSIFQENSQDFDRRFSQATLPEILEGKLQGKIDYMALVISAILYKNIGEPEKARNKYNYIFDTLAVKTEDVVGEIVFISLLMQDSASALKVIDKFKGDKPIPIIEDWLSIYTLKIAVYSHMKDIQNFENTLSESNFVLALSQLPKNRSTVKNFRRMGEFIAPYKPDYALRFIDDALKYSIQLNIQEEIPKCYHELGRINFYKSSYKQAIAMTAKALELYDEKNLTHVWNKIKAKQLIGACYIRLGQYSKGTKEFKKSIQLIEQTNVDREVASTYSLLSEEFFRQKEFSKAIYYTKKAISISETINDKVPLNVALFSNLGFIYKASGNIEEGIKWFSKSIQESKKLVNISKEICPSIINTYISLIEILDKQKRLDQSQVYKSELLELNKQCTQFN